MSDSVRPHRRQPTRLPRPWDSPGKNTGVGCHFLLQCMKVKRESEVAQSCLILSDPMDCSPPGSSVHGIFQARVPEWGAIEGWRLNEIVYGKHLGQCLAHSKCSVHVSYYYIQPLGDGKTGMHKSKLLAQLQSSGEGEYRQN